MSRTRTRAAALGLVVAASSLVLGAAPSYAEHGGILVSDTPSGPFGARLVEPLFDGESLLVPERRSSATFYVRNDSTSLAHLTFASTRGRPRNDLADALGLSFDVKGTEVARSAHGPPPTCESPPPNLRPGQVVPVRVHLVASDLHGQAGMGQTAQLEVVITLTEVVEADPVAVCGVQEHAGPEGDDDPGTGCHRPGAVVTVVGAPTCVPTSVEAGTADDEGSVRSPGSAGLAALALVLAGWSVGWLVRRREGDRPA